MSESVLPYLLRHQSERDAGFSAVHNLIGLFSHPHDADLSNLTVKMENPSQEKFKKFLDSLTAAHELLHYVNFYSSAWGLNFSVSLLRAYQSASQENLWNIDAGLHSLESQSRADAFSACQDFLYFYEQITSLQPEVSAPADDRQFFRILAVSDTRNARHKFTGRTYKYPNGETIKLSSFLDAKLYYSNSELNEEEGFKLCNTTSVFENLATISEFIYLFKANPDSFIGKKGIENLFDFIKGKPHEYRCLIEIYLFKYSLPFEYFANNIEALLDIALMWSPHLYYGLSPTMLSHDKRELWRTPFEIFLDSCSAAKNVEGIKSSSSEDAQRYQDEVCRNLGIPTVKEMTQHCLKICEEILESFSKSSTGNKWNFELLNGLSIATHLMYLKERDRIGNAFFSKMRAPLFLETLLKGTSVIHQSVPGPTIFDAKTRSLWSDPDLPRLFFAVRGEMLARLINPSSDRDCPLKKGVPIFCGSLPDNESWCATVCDEKLSIICPYYHLRDRFEK